MARPGLLAVLTAAFLVAAIVFFATPREKTTAPGPHEMVAWLQRSFNQRECEAVYDSAAVEFKWQLSPVEWASQCERMRTQSGEWESTEGSPESCHLDAKEATGLCDYHGFLHFSKGAYWMAATWFVHGGEAKLARIYLIGKNPAAVAEPLRPPSEPKPLFPPKPRIDKDRPGPRAPRVV